MRQRRERTKTSSFGTAGRISHDSSRFYSSRLYDELEVPSDIEYIENPIDESLLNRVYCKSSESMEEIPDSSVHLMVTSPPYNVSKEYDEDLSIDEYRSLIRRVMSETYRKLVPGGRACINIANVGRKPYIPLHAFIIEDMLSIGYYMRGEIIWDKGSSAGVSTAWGSWRSAANPVLRDVHEYILVFCKGTFSRKARGRNSTIEREEFLAWTKSVWSFPSVSAKSIGHPAPFPIELPRRLIQLYTFEGDVVLDPFCGSGTTCLAALESDRYYIGYEIKQEYVDLAMRRIREESVQQHGDTENNE
ncbi:MAG: site-specific DNA-methyltransferase [Bacillota bacterium]|nr:site-specific DNA-methyltransferase [Bacillota bacterium]HOB91934.1 site-specific DNA-methyltransferase [Bacillota bacterium]HPZ55080.1 site-specific DNA-methyltransferase [Bacillota bacterium]HQD19063.1 site-specific DNA-methyltransferase [Bacillota bacterium]